MTRYIFIIFAAVLLTASFLIPGCSLHMGCVDEQDLLEEATVAIPVVATETSDDDPLRLVSILPCGLYELPTIRAAPSLPDITEEDSVDEVNQKLRYALKAQREYTRRAFDQINISHDAYLDTCAS